MTSSSSMSETLFEPKLAVYVAEREWHPSQKLKHRADGRVEIRLETTGRKELVRWVLSWIPDVKVLAPKSLRDRIAEKAAEFVETIYKDSRAMKKSIIKVKRLTYALLL